MQETPLRCDVAIVGLGPTGAVLANLLGRKGWSVVALERDEDIYYAPRAVHFDDEIMRIFQSIGLAEAISKTSEPFSRMEFLKTAGGPALLRSTVGSQAKRYGHAGAWWFHQPTLERHLWDGMSRFANVSALRGVEAVGLDVAQDRPRLRARRADGSEFIVSARYVVGCDGGRSFTRKAIGVELDSADFDEAWVVIDAKSRKGGKDPAMAPVHQQICDPRQPITYVPMAGPYYEWQFMVTGAMSEREATDPAYVRQQLRAVVDLDSIDIVRIAYYRFHALWAREWRKGRVFLAGDCAHQMPPFLGQGMCSGLRDAQSLAWRLDLVLAGKAGDALLDDYPRERAEHVGHIVKGAMFLGRVIQTRNPWIARLRNALLFWPSRTFAPVNRLLNRIANRKMPLSVGFIGKTSRMAGTLAIQPHVGWEGRDMLLDDALGDGFCLIARAGAFERASATLKPLQIKTFEIGGAQAPHRLIDIEGRLTAWFDQNGIDFVLLRPDRYVFDAGRAGQLAAVVAEFQRRFPAPAANLAVAA